LLQDYGDTLDEDGRGYLRRVRAASQRMGQLIDAILTLSRVTRGGIQLDRVDLSTLAHTIAGKFASAEPGRDVEFEISPELAAEADPRLMRALLENLLGNAWKLTAKTERATIVFGVTRHDGESALYIRDNGAGFDMAYADKLFTPFQRLHKVTEFEGTGVGLATVARIIQRHGGRIWAEGVVDRGATVHFTLENHPGTKA
jgi:light-regulated signal transduction histidine kinase (bacteriophytochrome)